MKRGLLTASRLLQETLQRGSFRYRVAMLTLTYAPHEDWDPKQVTHLLKCIREYLRRRGHSMQYVWVLELTKSGKEHYHVLIWLPRGVTLPKPDKRGWWRQGWTRIEWARNPIGYVAKYASKGTEGTHNFPPGARVHGSGGLTPEARRERRWWLCPSYVREIFPSPELDVARAKGGGWVARQTGEFLESRYMLAGFGNQTVYIREKPGWAFRQALRKLEAMSI